MEENNVDKNLTESKYGVCAIINLESLIMDDVDSKEYFLSQ